MNVKETGKCSGTSVLQTAHRREVTAQKQIRVEVSLVVFICQGHRESQRVIIALIGQGGEPPRVG